MSKQFTMRAIYAVCTTMATAFATGCSPVDAVQPTEPRIVVSLARVPVDSLAPLDTISLVAVVYDGDGKVVEDGNVAWKVIATGRLESDALLGWIVPTGARTALLSLGDAASIAEAGFTLVGPSQPLKAQLQVTPTGRRWGMFLWSREEGFFKVPSPPGTDIHPYAINDKGQVVGLAVSRTNGEQTFVWSASNGFRYLGRNGAQVPFPTSINSSGAVTGWLQTNNSPHRAFVWNGIADATIVPEFMNQSQLNYSGTSINGRGEIAGNVMSNTVYSGFRWSPENGGQLLRGNGAPNTLAVAINDPGQVLGYDGVSEVWDPGLIQRNPLLWSADGKATEILPDCNRRCEVDLAALNNRGEVAGTLELRAFRWAGATGVSFIPGSSVTWARGMNDAGDVVVATLTSDGTYGKALLWTGNGNVIELGLPSGSTRVYVRGVNNAGVVMGGFQ